MIKRENDIHVNRGEKLKPCACESCCPFQISQTMRKESETPRCKRFCHCTHDKPNAKVKGLISYYNENENTHNKSSISSNLKFTTFLLPLILTLSKPTEYHIERTVESPEMGFYFSQPGTMEFVKTHIHSSSNKSHEKKLDKLHHYDA